MGGPGVRDVMLNNKNCAHYKEQNHVSVPLLAKVKTKVVPQQNIAGG